MDTTTVAKQLTGVIAETMPVIGIFFLGTVAGLMIGVFILRKKSLTVTALSGSLSMLSGGAVIAIFRFLDPHNAVPQYEYWFYPIGLFIGLVFAIRTFHFNENLWGD